jgi:RhtB (resistance to homoserine/threonine) family protein
MEYISIILSVAAIHLLVVMSPGPDFIMTVRNSLMYSRRSGFYSSIGLGLGILLHISYCLAGLAIIISQSVVVFSILKYVGAAYLLYIGYKSLRAKPNREVGSDEIVEKQDMTKFQAIRSGFITNATNPKATLFFLSLFTVVIQPSTPFAVKAFMGIEMAIATALWFSLVTVLVSHRVVRHRITRFQHYIERFMGGVLILFGIKLATTNSH